MKHTHCLPAWMTACKARGHQDTQGTWLLYHKNTYPTQHHQQTHTNPSAAQMLLYTVVVNAQGAGAQATQQTAGWHAQSAPGWLKVRNRLSISVTLHHTVLDGLSVKSVTSVTSVSAGTHTHATTTSTPRAGCHNHHTIYNRASCNFPLLLNHFTTPTHLP